MTQQDFKRAFDQIVRDNLSGSDGLHAFRIITDSSCMIREQLGINHFSAWPIHVEGVIFESMNIRDIE